MANKDTKKIINSAKRITAEASQTLVNTATIVIDKAQTAIAETTTKIKVEHQAKKTAENQARRLELEATLKDLQGTCAPMMLNALCESPVALTKPNIQRMRELFPIPVEQRIIWADAEFDLRPSGIVCTGTGVFIKTNVGVWEEIKKRYIGAKQIDPFLLQMGRF